MTEEKKGNYETDAYVISVVPQADSTVLIEGEIKPETLERYRSHAVAHVGESVSVPGFRKGKVPEAMLVKHVGEMRILEDIAGHALEHEYPNMVREAGIQAIGRPEITITKLAPGILAFKAVTAVVPTVTLPDYRSIAAEIYGKPADVSVTEKEVEEGVEHLRIQWAKSEKFEKARKERDADSPVVPAEIEVTPEELPEVTDEFVAKLGPFANVEDFKTRFRENMLEEKKKREHDRRRGEVLTKIREKTEVTLPKILVESELAKMISQFEGDVVRAGFKLDEYLTQANKTIADLQNEWRPEAEKQAKNQLVLNEIAQKESIAPDERAVEAETTRLLSQYPEAEPLRARIYVDTVMTNEAVFVFLEKTGSESPKKDAAPKESAKKSKKEEK